MPFKFNILNLNDILSSSFNKIYLSNLLSTQKLRVLNCMEPNLSKLMVHNFKLQNLEYLKYNKCLKLKCPIRPFANE